MKYIIKSENENNKNMRLSHMKSFLKKIVCMYKVESYCLKCKNYTGNIDPEISGTSNSKKNDIIKICYMQQ